MSHWCFCSCSRFCPYALRPLPAALASLFLLAPALAQQAPSTPSAPVEADTVMPEVTIEDKRFKETGYKVDRTRVAKTAQDLRDVPNSVSVVPEQLIFDRGADNLRDALRNVAGVTFNAGEGGRIGDNITIRGYSAVGDLFLDGMRDVAQYNREVFNLERIEVLRGSASMLFGRGSTGGVINQVSKTPQPFDNGSVAQTFGTDQYARTTLDVNKAFDQSTALRLNAMYTDTDSFRDAVSNKREGIAPALTFGLGGRNELTLAYMHLDEKNIPDFGVPFYQGRPLDVPVERFYGMGNADYERNTTDISTATYTHRFAPHTEWRTQLRYAEYERDLWGVAPRLLGTPVSITDATVINRQRQARGGEEQTWTLQSDFNTRLQTGSWRHDVLAGVEYAREQAVRWSNVGAVVNPPTTVGNPDPFPPLPPLYFSSQTRTNFNSYDGDSIGVYAQDYAEFRAGWKLLLGGRWDRLKADYDRTPPAGPLSRDDAVWSWRTGLVYQPDDMQSYYVAYGTSFNPSAELYQLDDRTANTPPEKNRNTEIGAKFDLLGGYLAIRTALFRSEKTNERNTDLSIPDVALLSGKRHTDGIELEVAGRINPSWDVFGSVAFMKGNIDVASGQQAGSQDKTPMNTPSYTASLWTTYRFSSRWRAGFGAEAVGNRWANTNNTNLVPHYVRVDGLVQYDFEPWTVKLNLFNILDEDYYIGVYQGHTVPGTTRAAQLTVVYRFL